jgi:putative selenate reductase
MPADFSEIKAAMDEGIAIQELVLPTRVNSNNGHVISLTCIRMKLEGMDAGGRPNPVAIPDSEFEITCDTFIPAIGHDPDIDFIDPKLLTTEPGIYETKLPGVFIGGDALRGPSTVINAIGDGRKIAAKIMKQAGITYNFDVDIKPEKEDYHKLMIKRMQKIKPVSVQEIPLSKRKSFALVTQVLTEEEVKREASRCLRCDELCNTCVTVCPNLALYPYYIDPFQVKLSKVKKIDGQLQVVPDTVYSISQQPQILHIADWCNECGNCITFCPTNDAPYKKKPHLYLDREAFDKDDDCYFMDRNNTTKLLYRLNGKTYELMKGGDEYIYKSDHFEIVLANSNLRIKDFNVKNSLQEVPLRKAADMWIILKGAKSLFPETKSPNANKMNIV